MMEPNELLASVLDLLIPFVLERIPPPPSRPPQQYQQQVPPGYVYRESPRPYYPDRPQDYDPGEVPPRPSYERRGSVAPVPAQPYVQPQAQPAQQPAQPSVQPPIVRPQRQSDAVPMDRSIPGRTSWQVESGTIVLENGRMRLIPKGQSTNTP